MFEISREGVKILGGLVHHAENALNGPACTCSCGARSMRSYNATQSRQRAQK
jgi:hypothetical protein